MRIYSVLAGVVLAGFTLLGAGCAGDNNSDQTFKGLDPKQAANKIQFMVGDTLEVRQTFMGIGAFLPDLRGTKDGIRQVTITRFAPMNVASLAWKIETQRESKEAVKVDKFEQVLVAPGTSQPEPKTVTENVTISGTITDVNLKASHSAFLPAYWKEGPMAIAGEKSGIWLSDDAYMELSRTQQTPLNFGMFDADVNEVAKNWNELSEAMNKLRTQANTDNARGDLTLLKADDAPVSIKLKVNGQEVAVQAIRARNWFGEILVLDNRQNPMILKVVVNPLFAGAGELLGGGLNSLEELFGYEVTNIVLNR